MIGFILEKQLAVAGPNDASLFLLFVGRPDAAAVILIIAVAPGENFVRGYFYEPPGVAFVVAKIPFVFVVEIIGQNVDDVFGSNVGFAFDEEDVFGMGQGQGHHLIMDEVGEFLAARGGADVYFAVQPDEPERRQVGTAVAPYCRQPNCHFAPQSTNHCLPAGGIVSSHGFHYRKGWQSGKW